MVSIPLQNYQKKTSKQIKRQRSYSFVLLFRAANLSYGPQSLSYLICTWLCKGILVLSWAMKYLLTSPNECGLQTVISVQLHYQGRFEQKYANNKARQGTQSWVIKCTSPVCCEARRQWPCALSHLCVIPADHL